VEIHLNSSGYPYKIYRDLINQHSDCEAVMSKSIKRKLVAIFAALLSTFLLTGCIKLDMDLTVNKDRTVSGTVIGAVSDYLAEMAEESGDTSSNSLTSELDSLFDENTPGVTVKEYKSGGFTGQQYILDRVAISELTGDGTDAEAFNITIVDNKVNVSGVLDLSMDEETTSSLELFGADLAKGFFSSAQMRIAIRFPGKVISSSGEISADGKQVVWTPVIGERNELSATVELPNAKKILTYAGIGIGALALLLVAFFLGRKGKKAVDGTPAKDPAEDATKEDLPEETSTEDPRDENS